MEAIFLRIKRVQHQEFHLDMGDSKVLFGYIVHKGEKIDESVQELIDFLVARLHKS